MITENVMDDNWVQAGEVRIKTKIFKGKRWWQHDYVRNWIEVLYVNKETGEKKWDSPPREIETEQW